MPNLSSCELRHLLENFAHLRARCAGDDVSTAKSIRQLSNRHMRLTFAAPGVLSAAGWPRIVISRLMAAMASHHARR